MKKLTFDNWNFPLFVICRFSVVCGFSWNEKIKTEITDVVRRVIGPIAKPDKIQIVSGLPKTRSGKIMRRILRKVASNDFDNLGDTSTLLNPDIVDEIIKGSSDWLVSLTQFLLTPLSECSLNQNHLSWQI